MSAIPSSSDTHFIPPLARVLAPYVILALAVFAAYGNIFDNGFVYDDDAMIVGNTYLRGWDHIGDILTRSTVAGAHIAGGFYRPAQMLLYLLVFHLGDGSPFLFHLLNLSLHIANSCLVYRLGTKLQFNPWGVFLAALIWGLHPLHTEAVTYMSATADELFTLFCLWSIVVLVPDITPRKILHITPLLALALLSKETAAMFPLLVMSCLFLTNPQRMNFTTYLRTWPLWGISLIYVFWRLHAAGFEGAQSYDHYYQTQTVPAYKLYADHIGYRIYTFLATLPAYLALLVWPQNLHMTRSFPFYQTLDVPVVTGLACVILVALHTLRNAKRPAVGIELNWGALWFLIALAPSSGIVVPINYPIAEHCMYLPSAGLLLGIAETIAKGARNRWVGFACSAAALIFAGLMSAKTYAQNAIWHDPVSLYGTIIRLSENSASAHGNLGVYYFRSGDYADAIDQFKQAIAVSDTIPSVRCNLAATYWSLPDRRDHSADAIANAQRALELDPHYYLADDLLGDIYDDLGDKDKAGDYRARAAAAGVGP